MALKVLGHEIVKGKLIVEVEATRFLFKKIIKKYSPTVYVYVRGESTCWVEQPTLDGIDRIKNLKLLKELNNYMHKLYLKGEMQESFKLG